MPKSIVHMRCAVGDAIFNTWSLRKLCQSGRLKEALQIVHHNIEQGINVPKDTFVFLVKECTRLKTLLEGKRVHALLYYSGYQSSTFLGNVLVDMYSNCGSILDARQVFDGMPTHNVFSWTVILSAYVKQNRGEEAVELFQRMQQAGVKPNSSTLVFLLKAYANLANWQQIRQVHTFIIQCGFELDVFIGSALVDIYAKLGLVEDACRVFKNMYNQDVVLWNTMIAGYTYQGYDKEGLSLFSQMQYEGVKPNNVTFLSALKACASLLDLEAGRQIHTFIICSGLEPSLFLESTLLDMYVKSGNMDDACQIFTKLCMCDVVSWNVMITGYAEQGPVEEALAVFEQMKQEGVNLNNLTVASILKACARGASLKQGKQVHAQFIRFGFESDSLVLNALVDMYAKCQFLEDARKVFVNIHDKSVVSWNVMLMGYSQLGLGIESITLFEQMQEEDVQPDNVTFVSVLSACAALAALEVGKHVHACIIRSGFNADVSTGSALIDMYAKCESIEDACIVFNSMQKHNMITWNTMIAACSQQGLDEQAFILFEKMKDEGMNPDTYTFVSVLKACANLAALDQGRSVHVQVLKSGFGLDVFVGSSLIDMYGKCWRIDDACQVFENIRDRDIVMWNAMIAGYTQHGMGKKAIALFEQMQQKGLKPDKVTFLCLLRMCSSLVDLETGKQVHAHVMTSSFHTDVAVATTLTDMYAKCGSIEKAREVFNNMSEPVVVSWNVMIAGYAQHGLDMEALCLFEKMQREGAEPDGMTFISILKACTVVAALERGIQIHAHIIRSGVDSDASVSNTLIDMYAKCGSIDDATNVFSKVHERDIISWNAMIMGHAQQGLCKEALTLFEQMQCAGVKPDEVTFICVLSACNHGGFMMEGYHHFTSMVKYYDFQPTMEHYACIVDLLGRAGCLSEAVHLINKMPMQPNAMVWMALLGACRFHVNADIGRHAFACLIKLEPTNASAYLLLSNIYDASNKWDQCANLHCEMAKE